MTVKICLRAIMNKQNYASEFNLLNVTLYSLVQAALSILNA